MPGVRPLTVFVLTFLAVAVFQSSAYSQTVTATLAKSSDTVADTVTLTPAATLVGFAANTPGTVTMKVWSLKNNGDDRKKYTDQVHQIMTDANGATTVQGTAGTQSIDFFRLDEGSFPNAGGWTWPQVYQAYNARAFKVYVTVTVDGVTKTAEASAPVVGGGVE